ncbi:hypothetical protein RQP46_000136 [Phenoliferia psychrophenolica]
MCPGHIISLFHLRTSTTELEEGAHVIITALVESGGHRSFVHVVFFSLYDDPRTDKFEINLVASGEREMQDETPANLEAFLVLRGEAEAHVRRLLPPLLTAPLPLHTATYATTSDETSELVLGPMVDWLVELDQYTQPLQRLSELVARTPAVAQIPVVDASEIQLVDGVRIGVPKLMIQRVFWRGIECAFKSLDPRVNDYHQTFRNIEEQRRSMARCFYGEIETLSRLPPHPNLVPSPLALVQTSRTTFNDPFIFGFLIPFYSGGTLRKNIATISIPLRLSYVRQLASVVHHLHRVAHTFHGDLKLDNSIISGSDNLVLVDLEQGPLNDEAAAPELLGEWDVGLDSQGRLEYTPYIGNSRTCEISAMFDAEENNWQAMREWADFPEALERAEVYAFGVTASNILLGRGDSSKVPMAEWEYDEGVPLKVREILEACMATDPLARPLLDRVLEVMESVAW